MRTTIDFQSVVLDDRIVSLYDAEYYGHMYLQFESIEEAQQCYMDTVAILVEAHDKLTKMGWSQSRVWSFMDPKEGVR